jgi:hypothetical protein
MILAAVKIRSLERESAEVWGAGDGDGWNV